MGADIDDSLALAMLHDLQDRAACRLLAVTLTNADPRGATLVDIINRFYQHPDIPIGRATNHKPAPSDYLKTVDLTDDGRPRYPSNLKTDDLPTALDVLRKTLAAEPDGSVVIVQVGFSSNLAALLASGPDAHSPLAGPDLIRKKVRLLSIMAGAFAPIEGDPSFKEYNVTGDLPATIALARDWPTPIVWSGFEIGVAAPYPATSIERDFAYVAHHPVADAYRLYQPMPYDRPTWDLTSVLYAVRPDRGYFDLSPPGRVAVDDTGVTRFTPEPDGRDRHLILRPDQRPRLVEALTQHASAPPRTR
jgi:inosine-uridine nucleoside N-ribohydrolase